ncbi:hypothetical protein ACX93W_15965 [Paenibacillus sp. CAU 1782]
MKLPTILMLSLLLIFSLNSTVFAHAEYGNSTERPTPGTAPDNGVLESPGGILDELAIDNIITPFHISLTPHVHEVINIFNTYDGYTDVGEVSSGYNGKSSMDNISFSITRVVSNGWNVDIGFSKNVIDAAVGYNSTWSTEKSFAYSSDVNPYKTVHIGYQDWFHVKEFNVKTDWALSPTTIKTDYGTGWSKQWYKYHFYSWET